MPDGPTLVSIAQHLVFGLELDGHGHTEVGVVNETVGKHKVDGDNGCQNVDLTNEDEDHGQQAGQADSRYWGLVWATLLQRKLVSEHCNTTGCKILAHK